MTLHGRGLRRPRRPQYLRDSPTGNYGLDLSDRRPPASALPGDRIERPRLCRDGGVGRRARYEAWSAADGPIVIGCRRTAPSGRRWRRGPLRGRGGAVLASSAGRSGRCRTRRRHRRPRSADDRHARDARLVEVVPRPSSRGCLGPTVNTGSFMRPGETRGEAGSQGWQSAAHHGRDVERRDNADSLSPDVRGASPCGSPPSRPPPIDAGRSSAPPVQAELAVEFGGGRDDVPVGDAPRPGGPRSRRGSITQWTRTPSSGRRPARHLRGTRGRRSMHVFDAAESRVKVGGAGQLART